MFNYIPWNVNPEIFHVGSLSVRWYGLLFALGFYFGYLIMARFFRKENVPIKELDRLTTYMVVGTIIGARLGHCMFYEPAYYLSHPLEILKIWEGGLASHGAAIGIILSIYLFSRKSSRSFLWTLDRIVIVVALAGVLIRLGNLMNSEIFGKPTDLPWAFVFIRDNMIPRHPSQIYEALAYLLTFIYLLKHYYRKNGQPRPGFLFGMFMIMIFTARFFIEFLKEPQVSFETRYWLNLGQSLSIPFVLLGIFMVWRSKKDSVPGII
ncbi:MAG: prolipoprotein diacylglyceryl transferase [Bacteroidales bacterium]|nr:prolipoprotein diacylglyceryl transferase [Lentimicrobiaceae bacterium]MDD5694283.1 prolipoprotein diacylglyceryl transferase [Bacteroidales bacterium]